MGDEAWRDRVAAAGNAVGELVWPMPIPTELRPALDSNVADITTLTGERGAGMLVGGAFLSDFVPNGLPCERAVFVSLPIPPIPSPPAPPPSHKCFVATAALGSEEHPSVIHLRALRDEISAASALGRTFIAVVNGVYESFSPRLAGYLERHAVPRRAVRDVVVRPVAGIVAATDRLTRPLPPSVRNATRVALLTIEGLLGIAALPVIAAVTAVRAVIEALSGERHA